MDASNTTIAVQRLLDGLGDTGSSADDSVVRELLARATERLRLLCTHLLHRSYPRLSRPPAYLDTQDVLGALVGRLLRALAEIKPRTVRQFFGLANQHLRWELNDVARRIDAHPRVHGHAHEPEDRQPPTGAGDGATLHRILSTIDALPDAEREAFELVRIQGLTHGETAAVLQIAEKTVQRRLRRALLLLAESLGDLVDTPAAPPPSWRVP